MHLVKETTVTHHRHAWIVIVSQAGTGKTLVAKTVHELLIQQKKKVALTTSTGIAGRQYNFNSATLHR